MPDPQNRSGSRRKTQTLTELEYGFWRMTQNPYPRLADDSDLFRNRDL